MNDYPAWYEKVSAPFRGQSARTAIRLLDSALVWLFAIAFVGGLAMLVATGDGRAPRFALVPAIAFALVSAARLWRDEPRPYELFDIDPIIRKDAKGKSMPSRHMASAVIIAFAFGWLNAAWGAAAFCACAGIAFTRIVGGVHFPRDIVVATVVSAVCGIVGFVVFP